MYQIQLNYPYPIFNKFDIIINNRLIENIEIKQTCTIDVPYQNNTLSIKNGFINSPTIQIKDGDTVIISIHPIVYILLSLNLLLFCFRIINFLLIVLTILIIMKYGFQLKVTPTSYFKKGAHLHGYN